MIEIRSTKDLPAENASYGQAGETLNSALKSRLEAESRKRDKYEMRISKREVRPHRYRVSDFRLRVLDFLRILIFEFRIYVQL